MLRLPLLPVPAGGTCGVTQEGRLTPLHSAAPASAARRRSAAPSGHHPTHPQPAHHSQPAHPPTHSQPPHPQPARPPSELILRLMAATSQSKRRAYSVLASASRDSAAAAADGGRAAEAGQRGESDGAGACTNRSSGPAHQAVRLAIQSAAEPATPGPPTRVQALDDALAARVDGPAGQRRLQPHVAHAQQARRRLQRRQSRPLGHRGLVGRAVGEAHVAQVQHARHGAQHWRWWEGGRASGRAWGDVGQTEGGSGGRRSQPGTATRGPDASAATSAHPRPRGAAAGPRCASPPACACARGQGRRAGRPAGGRAWPAAGVRGRGLEALLRRLPAAPPAPRLRRA